LIDYINRKEGSPDLKKPNLLFSDSHLFWGERIDTKLAITDLDTFKRLKKTQNKNGAAIEAYVFEFDKLLKVINERLLFYKPHQEIEGEHVLLN